MIQDKMKINDGKTEFVIMEIKQQLKKIQIDSVLTPLSLARNLGTYFDYNISLIPHIN